MGNLLRLQLVSVHPIRLTRSYLHPLSPQSPFPRDLSLINLHNQPRIIIRRRVHPPSHPMPRQHIAPINPAADHILNPSRQPGPPNNPITLKHHRHPMMDPRHKPRCIHCQHGERINPLVPIHPPVPQPREHHRLPVPPRHIPRLLVLLASHRFPLIKPTHRHHTPPTPHQSPKRRLLMHRLAPSVDHLRRHRNILRPRRNQPIPSPRECGFPIRIPRDQRRLRRRDIERLQQQIICISRIPKRRPQDLLDPRHILVLKHLSKPSTHTPTIPDPTPDSGVNALSMC